MRICHLCLHGPYNEGWSYQENLLAKYHALSGADVFLIATPYVWDANEIKTTKDTKYKNKYGVNVIRCQQKKGLSLGGRLERYPEVMSFLQEIKPDILFIHDVQCLDIITVVKYLKHYSNCTVYVDNHSDFFNSARNFLSKTLLHKLLWRNIARKINPYVKKFYGVLPARVDFLIDVYKLPEDKCELLVMGADDEEVDRVKSLNIREKKRKERGCGDNQICIVTGGKIDHNKPQIISLMKAVNELADEHIKLYVFGSVVPELKTGFLNQTSAFVHYIGWVTPEKIYDEFAFADLIAFPGLHSVLWEQAVGMGKPCVFKRIPGFDHIDLGGNCMFFESDSVDEYKRVICEAVGHIPEMKTVSEKLGIPAFSYKKIAEKSIGE
ncbi:MAG: glycosyl transferase family 1 [Clostridia bacterium]|nr:glycosyl transferase family 1 [Clostridia bacterium]